ncbi:MAG: hypothetical protein HYX74_00200, partial [Acidobacteria bacterium]|nr:hypothetical protein [Acidobacteriota bacterium]
MELGRFTTGVARIVAGASVAGLIVIAFVYEKAQAHKAITSKYTYNEDVYPILRDRCGRCHVSDGAAPMSLLTYKEALPWAESIRQELAHQRMPPWYADRASPISGYSLTARELNTLLTWATGGAPEGSPENRPEPATVRDEWPLGPPDLLIQIGEYTMPDGQRDLVQDFLLPTGLHEARWLRAADLRPGTPALVRSATIVVDSPAAHGNHETVLSIWQPGEPPPPVPGGVAFKLPADAHLRVQVRYKKPWYVHGAMSDQSAVGLYFAEQPAFGQGLKALPVRAAPSGYTGPRRFTCDVPGDIKVLAVIPHLD